MKGSFTKTLRLVMLVSALLMGCDQSVNETENPAAIITAFQQDLPTSFQGTLPCADCPGIDYHLVLFDDNTFFLKNDYQQSADASIIYYLGRWQLRDNQTLSLLSETQNFTFSIADAETLTLLDQTGDKINSLLNYSLKKDERFVPVYPQGLMRGVYQTVANNSFFTECLTGSRWKVIEQADSHLLQSRYLTLQTHADQPLFVNFKGQLTPQENIDSGKNELAVIVETFEGIWPVEVCTEPGYTENLLETHWQLNRLQGEAVTVNQSKHYPTLILSSGKDFGVSGSDGCNRIMGSYQLKENQLQLNKLATTMMACQKGMETAQSYHAALEQVQFWKIRGQTLDLFDRNSDLIAQFHAIREPE